jgi:hypothetical protein
MGGSDYGNAHASIDVAADIRLGFLPLLGKHRADSFFNKVLASLPQVIKSSVLSLRKSSRNRPSFAFGDCLYCNRVT